jgi:hypothetical protein
MADDPTTKEAAAIGFVVDDVTKPRWRMCLVTVHGIAKPAVRMDPENEFRKTVGQSPDRFPPLTKVLRQKVEPSGGGRTIH